MDEKTQFIADCLKRRDSISELCTNYCIGRKTGYKGIDRERIEDACGRLKRHLV